MSLPSKITSSYSMGFPMVETDQTSPFECNVRMLSCSIALINVYDYKTMVKHYKYAVGLFICNPRERRIRGRIYMSIIKHIMQLNRVEHTKYVTSYSQSEQQGLIKGTSF